MALRYENFREQREMATQERMSRRDKSLSDALAEVVDMPGARYKAGRNNPCPYGSAEKLKVRCDASPTLH